MSDELLGYREGTLDDMLVKVIELRNMEKQFKQQQNVAELFQAIKDLNDLAKDCGAK